MDAHLMSHDDLMRQAGARWCDVHTRWECSKASKRTAGPCHASAVRGTQVCKTHAGKPLATLKAQGEAAISAWRANPGQSSVSPADAVMAMLHMSWARVHVYASLLETQVEDADPSAGTGQGAGLVGHTYSASPSVGVYESGEAIRGLAQLEAAERDRCVRYAKVAHDMGIADREIKLAEQQGAMLAGAITKILDALDLTTEQQQLVPQVVPGVLLELARKDTA